MDFCAHIRDGAEQTVAAHCRGTAEYAMGCLAGIGLGECGYLAGLLHDMGKAKREFDDYLRTGQGIKGSVNHTFAGCRYILERFHGETAEGDEDLSAELLAIAIGAHHGLFDCVDHDRKSGFLNRMTKQNIGYGESVRNFLAQCADDTEIAARFAKANAELTPIYERLQALARDGDEFSFYLGLLARLLLSAVIEGDRRDTAEFMNDMKCPPAPPDIGGFWDKYLAYMEEKLTRFPQNSPIARARGSISDQCRAFAEQPGGVYRLNVPTGAGKTLSALRYALAHAKRWEKRRLIFTSPLLAILEQNAGVIRDFLGDDSIVLEHHSNVLRTEEGDELDHRELAVENWNAPVIVTTLVQLLNTLFDGRTTAIRRFQSLCGSVIVIDEVQTVPTRMLTLFNLAVDFLAEVCGATVLLCSATQPCLEKTAHPLRVCQGDVVPYDEALWAPFRRTRISDAGDMDLDGIVAFARQELEHAQSLLIVCNKRGEAEALFRALKGTAELSCHLSASMCTAHRRETLAALDAALKAGKKCLCVSTQVIEAGVDISFSRVIRLSAGLDNIIQAAGRCNRNCESETPVPVYIVPYMGENLSRLRDIQQAKNATTSLLEAYRRNPGGFGGDLSSDASVEYYYQKLYAGMSEDSQDFYAKSKDTTLFELLGCNTKYYDGSSPFCEKFYMNQAFKLAGGLFQVFESDTLDAVVPYGAGAALIGELASQSHPSPPFLADWLRRAKPYTVSLYDYETRKLSGALREYSGVTVLAPEYYDEYTGLTLEPKNLDFLEV